MTTSAPPAAEAREVRPQFQEKGSDPISAGWRAELRLRFAADECGRTRLVERRHLGPLVIQRPFHPEGDPCHAYVVHPPGGVVGGDELHIEVSVDPGAHALMTTPAATKFYRCQAHASAQVQELRASRATLEWLPQESIFYRGANVRTVTRVRLDAHSKFIGWEIACLGLPARGEYFDAGALRLDLELWRSAPARTTIRPKSGTISLEMGSDPISQEMGSDPIFVDRLRLAGASAARTAAWGLAGHEAVGTLLATPAVPTDVDAIRSLVAERAFAAVSLVDGVLVLRVLARQAHEVRHLFITAWQRLRPSIVGRDAVQPRIWAT